MSRNLKRPWRWIVIALAVGLLCFSHTRAGKPDKPPGGGGTSYTIVQLDDGDGAWRCYPLDVNILGHVVGYVEDPTENPAERRAAYWHVSRAGGSIQSQLMTLTGGNGADGINDFGEVVGYGENSEGQSVALYWANAEAEPVVLPPLDGDARSFAQAINNEGIVCGNSLPGAQAVAWRVDWSGGEPAVWGPLALPSGAEESVALAITDNDAEGFAEIVGHFFTPQTVVAWTVQSPSDGTVAVDPVPRIVEAGDVHAFGVNDAGTICGDAGWSTEAVVWTAVGSQILHRDKKITSASAQDINNDGTIVGSGDRSQYGPEAVAWPGAEAKMILLNNYVGPKSPFVKLLEARAVNELGEIVGAGLTGQKFEPPFGRAVFLAIPE